VGPVAAPAGGHVRAAGSGWRHPRGLCLGAATHILYSRRLPAPRAPGKRLHVQGGRPAGSPEGSRRAGGLVGPPSPLRTQSTPPLRRRSVATKARQGSQARPSTAPPRPTPPLPTPPQPQLISTRVQASSLPLSVNDVYMLLTGPGARGQTFLLFGRWFGLRPGWAGAHGASAFWHWPRNGLIHTIRSTHYGPSARMPTPHHDTACRLTL
jgi:hypothetical protein